MFNDGDLGFQFVSHNFVSMYIAIWYFCPAPSDGELHKWHFNYCWFNHWWFSNVWSLIWCCHGVLIWDFKVSIMISYQCQLLSPSIGELKLKLMYSELGLMAPITRATRPNNFQTLWWQGKFMFGLRQCIAYPGCIMDKSIWQENAMNFLLNGQKNYLKISTSSQKNVASS